MREVACAELNFVSVLIEEMHIQFLSQEMLLDLTVETLIADLLSWDL